jgi:hypothetical protein
MLSQKRNRVIPQHHNTYLFKMSSETSFNEDRVSSAASYSELPIDPKLEIRILELLPPASPEPTEIHCNLTTARLADKPSYEALSYAWGDPVFPEKIYLPTGYLAITSNLAAALRQPCFRTGHGGSGLVLCAYKSIDTEQNNSET